MSEQLAAVDESAATARAFRRLNLGRAATGLLGGTLGTAGLNGSTFVLNFAATLLLSRLLGADGYGAYAFAFAWASVLSVLAVLGLTPLIVRGVAGYHVTASWGLMRGLLRRSNQAVLGTSVLTAVVAAGVGWLLYASKTNLLYPYWIGLLLVPLIALTSLRQAAMQGLGRVLLGRTPETLVAPLLLLLFVGLAYVLRGNQLSAGWAVGGQVAAMLVAFGVGALFLRWSLPAGVRVAPPAYDTTAWAHSALSLVFLNVMFALNAQAGTILLGLLGGAGDAGIFNVASRAALFISFFMLAATYPLMPLVARLHATGETQRIQEILTRSARAIFAFSLTLTLVLVVFAEPVMTLFGGDFKGGVDAFRILSVGELAKVALGFGGLALVMTGHERGLAKGTAVWAVLNLTLGAALIPTLGVDGAAVAGTVSGVVANIYLAVLAGRQVGIYAPIVRIFTRRRPS